MGRFLAALLCLAIAPGAVAAASIDRLDVERDGDAYTVVLEATLDAPLPAVWSVLTDFSHLADLSPSFLEVERLGGSSPGTQRVRTLARFCVFFVCRDVRQVQNFSEPAPGRLHAQIDPAGSDLSQGEADWRLEAQGAQARLHFESRLTPGFWIPPVVGPWAVQRGLSAEALVIVASLERIAREKAR